MKKIMILGAGDFQLPLLEKAAESYCVVLVAPQIPVSYQALSSRSYFLDVRNKEAILQIAREEKIDGVITDQTDIPVTTAAYVAEKMGLPGIGFQQALLFTNKAKMREKQEELGIPTLPNKTVFSPEEALSFYAGLRGRIIIKPADMQGSRGVQLCENERELTDKFPEAQRWSSNGAVIIERYASGREFVVEGMALHGAFRNLICGDTHYFQIPDAFSAKQRIFPTTADSELRDRILALNERIITGFGLKQGITHSEFIMDGDEIYLLETAARGGGVFISSDLIFLSTGICTEEFLLNIALGQQMDFPKRSPQRCCCGYMAFYIPDGEVIEVRGKDEVLSLPFVHRNQLEKLYVGKKSAAGQTDKTSRHAMIVSAPDHSLLQERMQYIRNCLQVKVKTANGEEGLIWE